MCDVVLQSLCQDFDKLPLCKEEPDDPVLFCLCSASSAELKYVLIVKVIEWQDVRKKKYILSRTLSRALTI